MKALISIALFFIAAVSLDTAAQSIYQRRNSDKYIPLLPQKKFGVIVSSVPVNAPSVLQDFPEDTPSYKQKLKIDSIVSILFYKKEYENGVLINQREITRFCNAHGKMFFEYMCMIKPNTVTDILLLFSNGSIYKTWHTPLTDDYRWLWKFYQYPPQISNQEIPILLVYKDVLDTKKLNPDLERLPLKEDPIYYKSLGHYFIYSYKIDGKL